MSQRTTATKQPLNAFSLSIEDLALAEFDIGGVLYHANYFHLYERARETLLRAHGFPYSELVQASTHLAIVESHQHFAAPISYGQELQTFLWVTQLKRSSIVFHYEIAVKPIIDVVVHTAWTKNVFVGKKEATFAVQKFPARLTAIFEKYVSKD